MCVRIRDYIARFMLLACLPLALSACGGGGGSNGPTPEPVAKTTLTGIVTKGKINGAKVSVYLVDKNGIQSPTPLNATPATTDADGKYSVEIPLTTEPVLLEVKGAANATYVSEVTGKAVPFAAAETMRAIVRDASRATNITVSPFTQEAYDRLKFVKQTNPSAEIATSIDAANSYVAVQNKISDILAVPDKSYTAALTIVEQIIQTQLATNPAANTQTVGVLLTNSATTSDGNSIYLASVSAAITTLATSNPAVAASIAAEATALQTAVAATPSAVEPIPVAVETLAPIAPKNLNATFPVTTGTPVTLTWDAAVPAEGSKVAITGYEVYRNGALLTSTTALTYIDTTAVIDATYVYKVKAINANKIYSAFSNEKTITPVGNPLLTTTVTVTSSGSIQ